MGLCDTCHAGCCRSFAVPVTGADILRIERALGLSFWDFVCRWADPDGIIANKHAPQFHFSDDPRTPFVICLTHDDSEFLKGTTRCSFLVEGAPDAEHPCGVARCGIYQSRPAACRVFPTKLNATGDLAVIYDVPACGRKDASPAYQLCPRPWEPSDLDALETFQNLVVAKAEMEFFADVADVWNRKPRPWAIFPDFLKLVYSTRIRREHELFATTQHHDQPATVAIRRAA